MQNRFFSPHKPETGLVTFPKGTLTIFKSSMILLITLSVFFMLFITACSGEDEIPLEENSEIVVSTALATQKTYAPVLQLTGTVFANREANLGAGFPGRIEKIHYPEGSSVGEGQLLVEMAGEMLAQAEAEYLTLKRDYDRVSRLVIQGSVSRQEYDHVKARFEASAAKYELAKKNTQIRAPFPGVIVDYMAHEGENYFLNFNLEPGYSSTSGILRLMQLDPLKVRVDVNEKDMAHVSKGLKAQIEVEAYPGELLTGEVSLVKPYLSTRSRTAAVEITIPNPEMRLKPGMFARVNLQLPGKTEVFLPMEALYRDPETDTELVFVVSEGHVQQRQVQRINGVGAMLVVSGIEDGDEVIIGGKTRVQQGDAVIIVNN